MTILTETVLLPSDIRNLLLRFKNKVSSFLGESLDKVILYGSYSRGDYEPGSDMDILILLRKPVDKTSTDIISDIGSYYLIKNNLLFSVLLYETAFYNEWKSTMDLFIFIEQEGKII